MPKSKVRAKARAKVLRIRDRKPVDGAKRMVPNDYLGGLTSEARQHVDRTQPFECCVHLIFGQCVYKDCDRVSRRWPMTVFAETRQAIFYPACEEHEEIVQALSCKGEDCADHTHSDATRSDPDWVTEQINLTIENKFMVGVQIKGPGHEQDAFVVGTRSNLLE